MGKEELLTILQSTRLSTPSKNILILLGVMGEERKGKFDIRQIRQATGMEQKTAKRHIDRLVDVGAISIIPNDNKFIPPLFEIKNLSEVL
jgi:Fic family protein